MPADTPNPVTPPAFSRRPWLVWMASVLGGSSSSWAQTPPPKSNPPQPAISRKPAASLPVPEATPAAGQVEKVQGRAQVERFQQRGLLKQGDALYTGDRLLTANDTELVVRLSDGSVLSVRPNTDMLIDTYQFTRDNVAAADEDALLVQLARGTLRVLTGMIGKLNPAAVRVFTPTATIGVRGTDFETLVIEGEAAAPPPPENQAANDDIDETNADAGTYTTVFEGLTTLEADNQMIDLAPGQAGFAPLDLQLARRPFGLLPRVPRLFRPNPNDRLLQRLQQDSVQRLQRDLGDRLRRPLPEGARYNPAAAGAYNTFMQGISGGPAPFMPAEQNVPFGPGNNGGGALMDMLRRR